MSIVILFICLIAFLVTIPYTSISAVYTQKVIIASRLFHAFSPHFLTAFLLVLVLSPLSNVLPPSFSTSHTLKLKSK
jgi:hypothetical protein